MRNFRLTAPATALWVLMAGPALSATIPVEQYVVNLADVNTNVPAYNMGCLITTGECRVNPTDTAAAFSTLSPMTPGAAGLSNVVEDTTPQLGGSLDVNGQSIVSVSNGNIAITPNGTGSVVLDGLNWPQADGTNGYVLTTNGAGQLSFAAQTGGGDMSAATYDPTSVAGDAFDMANMVEAADAKVLTAAERSLIAAAIQPADNISGLTNDSGFTTTPTDAQYIVSAANGTLSAERVVTDTPTVDMDTGTAGQLKAHVRYLRAVSANSVTTAGGWTPALDDVSVDRASVTATSGATLVVAIPSASNAVSGSEEWAALEIANATGGAITVDLSAYTVGGGEGYLDTISNGNSRAYTIMSLDGGTTWRLQSTYTLVSGYASATVDLANDLCPFGDTNDGGKMKYTACTNISGGGGGTVDTSGTPVANDFAKFTDANTIEGRSYSETRADLDLEVGTDVQAYDADLSAVAGLSSSGLVARTGAGTAAARTLTAGNAQGSVITNGDGVSGNPTISVVQTQCAALGPNSFAITDGATPMATGERAAIYFDTAATVVKAYMYVQETPTGTAPTGADIQVDINENGTTMLSQVGVIQATEFDTDAGTPPVFSDTAIAAGSSVAFNVDQIGSTEPGAGVVGCIRYYH